MPSPGEDIQSWSTVAINNGTADPLINWVEGQTRASVNNSSRSELAAHAKHRNLNNGSIVTTGSANTQAFLSGVNYTSIPNGLTARLKVGAGLTNTASMTLNMDGIGDLIVKTANGDNLRGGEFVAGGYVDLLTNGVNWVFLYSQQYIEDRLTGGGGIIVGQQVFATAGTSTYTPTAGMECCIIECVGGGGGGGGATVNLTTEYMAGGGGGSGGYSRVIKNASEVGASQSVTVGAGGIAGIAGGPSGNGGAGGTTSVGTLCIANGGAGGLGASSAQVAQGGQGASAWAGPAGAVCVQGTSGESGVYNSNVSAGAYIFNSGTGASSVLGGGSQAFANSNVHAGFVGGNYGGGGGGGSLYGTAGGSANGGAGSAGICIITEFAGRGAPGRDGEPGATGPIGPPGPAGAGTGDVLVSGVPAAGQIAQWTDTSHIQGVPASNVAAILGYVPNCGRLIRDSATQLKFMPHNGDRIKINGQIYAIPAAGVSIANSSVLIDFASGSLAANTSYLVCLYNLGGGVLAPQFFTNLASHSMSTATDNVGVEIGPADSLTLIGLVRTNASAQFVDTPAQRFVRSWFNRVRPSLEGGKLPAAGITIGAVGWVNLGTAYQIEWLNWADEAVDIVFCGHVWAEPDGNLAMGSVGIDGAIPAAPETGVNLPNLGFRGTIASRYSSMPAEGYHFALPLGRTTGSGHYGATVFAETDLAARLTGKLA